METMQKLETLIRGNTPVIAINSAEEKRVLGEINVMFQEQNKRMLVWSVALGFRQVLPSLGEYQKAPDPLAAIVRAISEAQVANPAPTVWVFNDLHQFAKNPAIMRAIRDFNGVVSGQVKGVNMILLGAHIEVPEDANKDVTLLEFPLPDVAALGEQVEAFITRLPKEIKVNLNGGRARLISALKGLTKAEADSVLSQAVVTHRILDERAIAFVLEMKAQIIKASGALEYYAEKASYDQIGGLDLLKGWARQAEDAITPEAKEFGVEAPKGCLLVGVPGCGKSLTAKAIAGSNRPLLRLDIGALFGGLVGQSEQQTRAALKICEAVAPCVLWIDEIEKGLGGNGGELNGGVSDRVLGTILTWMQEVQADVFIVATANDVSGIRPELIRRFPVKFFVDLPNADERAQILAIHLGKRKRQATAFDLDAVVSATVGFTGSELEEIVQGALMRAFSRQAADVSTADLLAVVAQTVPLSATMAEKIAEMRRWSERARPASSKQASGHQAEAPLSVLEL